MLIETHLSILHEFWNRSKFAMACKLFKGTLTHIWRSYVLNNQGSWMKFKSCMFSLDRWLIHFFPGNLQASCSRGTVYTWWKGEQNHLEIPGILQGCEIICDFTLLLFIIYAISCIALYLVGVLFCFWASHCTADWFFFFIPNDKYWHRRIFKKARVLFFSWLLMFFSEWQISTPTHVFIKAKINPQCSGKMKTEGENAKNVFLV
jgi:hypothetical protein